MYFPQLKIHLIALFNLSFIICVRGTDSELTFCNLRKRRCIARRPLMPSVRILQKSSPGGEFGPLSFVCGWWGGLVTSLQTRTLGLLVYCIKAFSTASAIADA